jgi:hypothetical protein
VRSADTPAPQHPVRDGDVARLRLLDMRCPVRTRAHQRMTRGRTAP